MKLVLFTCSLILSLIHIPSLSIALQDPVSSNESTQTNDTIARRGCCSHHDGVCGCSGGRAKCCDRTLSPSCGCLKDSLDDGILSEVDQDCLEVKDNQDQSS